MLRERYVLLNMYERLQAPTTDTRLPLIRADVPDVTKANISIGYWYLVNFPFLWSSATNTTGPGGPEATFFANCGQKTTLF